MGKTWVLSVANLSFVAKPSQEVSQGHQSHDLFVEQGGDSWGHSSYVSVYAKVLHDACNSRGMDLMAEDIPLQGHVAKTKQKSH